MDEKSRTNLNTSGASLETAPSSGREVAVRSAIASRGVATRVLEAPAATSLEELEEIDVVMQHARWGDRVYLDSAVSQHSASVAYATDEGGLPLDLLVQHAVQLSQPHTASDDSRLSASLTPGVLPVHDSSRVPISIQIISHSAVTMGDGTAYYGARATEDVRELSHPPSEADILALKAQAKAYLQAFYQRECQLKCLFYDLEPIPIDQAPKLVLVKEEEQKEKEQRVLRSNQNQKTEWRDERLASFEDLHKPKEPIDLKNLFTLKDKSAQPAKRFLIVGRAGIGKTVLSKFIASKNQALWGTQFEWVFLIPLRNLKEIYGGRNRRDELKLKLAKVILCECFPDEKSISEAYIQHILHSEKVLLILDGYDELSSIIPESALTELLNFQHVILTSRPYSLPDWHSYNFVQLENMGFSNEAINEYINKFFTVVGHRDYAPPFLQFLKQNSAAWGIAHIPINLELICSLWEEKRTADQKIITPFTLTSLYQDIVLKLLKRYLLKRDTNPISERKLSEWEDRQVYEETDQVIIFLEKLAFCVMQLPAGHIIINNQEVIQPLLREIRSDHRRLLKEVLDAQLLKDIGAQKHIAEKDYYFIHLTFQEFFAAKAIVRRLKEINATADEGKDSIQKIILKHRYDPCFQLIWQFVSGLLADDVPTLKQFFDILRTEPRDLLGNYERYLLVHCLAECKEPKELGLNRDQIFTPLLVALQNKNMSKAAADALENLSVTATPNLMNALLEKLQDKDIGIRKAAAYVLGHMGTMITTCGEMVDALLAALRDKASNVRDAASWALVKLSTTTSPKVLDALLIALKDENKSIRYAIATALKKIDGGAATPTILNALVSTLRDEASEVSAAASEAFENMGTVVTSAVLHTLLEIALRDKRWYSRHGAILALGEMGSIAATPEVVNTLLLIALQHEEKEEIRMMAVVALEYLRVITVPPEVLNTLLIALRNQNTRDKAILVLGSIGIAGATPELVNELLIDLQNGNGYTRHIAADTLKKIGAVTTPEVLNTLIRLVRDGMIDVAVVEALGSVGITTATPEVLNALLAALRDKHSAVRSAAAFALENLGAATAIVMDALVATALYDREVDVKDSAVHALGSLCTAAVLHEVVNTLLAALRDKTRNVRFAVTHVLEKLGNIAVTSKVLNALLGMLRDVDKHIRHAAARALGNMGVAAVTSEVLNALLVMPRDEKPMDRSTNIDILKKMGLAHDVAIFFNLLSQDFLTTETLYTAVAITLAFRFAEHRTAFFYDPSVSALCCWEKGILQRIVLPPEKCHFFIQAIQKAWIEHIHLPLTSFLFSDSPPAFEIRAVDISFSAPEPVLLASTARFLPPPTAAVTKTASISIDRLGEGAAAREVALDAEEELIRLNYALSLSRMQERATSVASAIEVENIVKEDKIHIRVQQIIDQLEKNHQRYQQLLLTVGESNLPFKLWKLRTGIYHLQCELWECLEKSDREKKDFYKKNSASIGVVPLSVMVGDEERFFTIREAYGDGWCALYAAGVIANKDKGGAQAAVMRLVREIERSNPEVVRHVAESLEHNARANALDGGDEAWAVIRQEVVRLLRVVEEAGIDTEVYQTKLVSFTSYIERPDIQIAYLHYLCRSGYADAGIVSACLSLERKKLVVIYRPSFGCIRTDIDQTANLDDVATVCVIFNGNPNPRLAHYDGLVIQPKQQAASSQVYSAMPSLQLGPLVSAESTGGVCISKRSSAASSLASPFSIAVATSQQGFLAAPTEASDIVRTASTLLAPTARFLPPPTLIDQDAQFRAVLQPSKEEADASKLALDAEQERIQLNYALCLSRMQERAASEASAAAIEYIEEEDGSHTDSSDDENDSRSSMSVNSS